MEEDNAHKEETQEDGVGDGQHVVLSSSRAMTFTFVSLECRSGFGRGSHARVRRGTEVALGPVGRLPRKRPPFHLHGFHWLQQLIKTRWK